MAVGAYQCFLILWFELNIEYIPPQAVMVSGWNIKSNNFKMRIAGVLRRPKNKVVCLFYSKESLPQSFSSPPDFQLSKNMHKTDIFEQKKYWKKTQKNFLAYLPYFFSDHYRKQTIYYFRSKM